MKNAGGFRAALLLAIAAVSGACARPTQTGAAGVVSVEHMPGNGVAAELTVGPTGIVHLASIEGSPENGDLMYRRRGVNDTAWSAPIRIDRAGAAIAVGTIRGPRIAEGRRGLVHVLWNGSSKVTTDNTRGAPLLYARVDGSRVSPSRNLMSESHLLDGGAAIAADQAGHVYALWHGLLPPHVKDSERNGFISVSTDDGETFSAERIVNPQGSGACGCCGMAATVAPGNGLLWLFRAATNDRARDMMLMRMNGDTPSPLLRDPWTLEACPLSTSAFASTGDRTLAAWETRGQIMTAEVKDGVASKAVPAPGNGQRRFPAVAVNSAGDMLLAWTEGAAWGRGGDLAWVVLEHGSRKELASGAVPKLRTWTKPVGYAKPDGTFVVLY